MAEPGRFRITAAVEEPERITLRVAGEIVFHNQHRAGEMILLATLGKPRVILDLAALDYIDSAGVALLVRMSGSLKAAGRSLAVTNPGGIVAEIFGMLSLGSVVEVV